MRVELPEGYVPPQPTHPDYGYLTPQERAGLDAAEPEPAGRERDETEPVAEPVAERVETGSVAEPVAEIREPSTGGLELGTPPRPPGWVPPPPPSPPAAPELRWDAYHQEWVAAEKAAPPPDVAAAAGGRGSSSSWTSADGQRFRWDASAQE